MLRVWRRLHPTFLIVISLRYSICHWDRVSDIVGHFYRWTLCHILKAVAVRIKSNGVPLHISTLNFRSSQKYKQICNGNHVEVIVWLKCGQCLTKMLSNTCVWQILMPIIWTLLLYYDCNHNKVARSIFMICLLVIVMSPLAIHVNNDLKT